MTSLRHNTSSEPSLSDGDHALLDAARAAILAVGWKRTTLTDVARRAGVSRMTLYRRWPDMQTLLADLMTREFSGAVREADDLAGGITATVTALRTNELFRKIVEVDPELLVPYLLDRRGRTQDVLLSLVEAAIAAGQEAGEVRAGDPGLLARSLLLAAHGFAISAQTMTDAGVSEADLDAELAHLVERYLAA
ncbi:TetR/AcrR family transcriptional regulator [Nocardioides iriomotensis]|uniref:TetR/AcrR family transcriptional regulator n=1 Tax=Nocardioides iriomotensis TaxID=715784 RepID=A0A4Q5IY52_9ACTN|nr:TetR/AcrR family transcriptional regulator [Nocardioides iriomotensis]RYU10158.1 TetR/AcrR family transcriptional regulator [Nocardioides iriomotensis]